MRIVQTARRQIFAAVFLLAATPCFSRDINLDEIYIKKSSPILTRLLSAKLDCYEAVGAHFVDRDIVFARWQGGNTLVYIKELSGDINIVYRYQLSVRRRTELMRFEGALSAAAISRDGRFLALKRMRANGNTVPTAELLLVDTVSGTAHSIKSNYYFQDFTFSPTGNSLIYETDRGIVRYSPEFRTSKLILARSVYNAVRISANPCLAYESPDASQLLVINGGGGRYAARFFVHGKPDAAIEDISSTSELFWTDSQSIAYRTGYTAHYGVKIFNVETNSIKVLEDTSLNTNIFFSPDARILSFLSGQMINTYNVTDGILIRGVLEGEDVVFSPSGNRFVSLLYKKLFVVERVALMQKSIELKRLGQQIILFYSEASKTPSCWENNFSRDYIAQKISAYTEMIK